MKLRRIVVVGACGIALSPIASVGSAVANSTVRPAAHAARARSCADWHRYSSKWDYYGTHIRVTGVRCATADKLLKARLRLSGWHVSKKLAGASSVEKIYKVKATRRGHSITLDYGTLKA